MIASHEVQTEDFGHVLRQDNHDTFMHLLYDGRINGDFIAWHWYIMFITADRRGVEWDVVLPRRGIKSRGRGIPGIQAALRV